MITRMTEFPGYLIRFGDEEPSTDAVLIFHGFPANRGVKNLDLADLLFRDLKKDVYILHYRGLGESIGAFKFTDTIVEASEAIDHILKLGQYQYLHLVGHSWGGLVASNAALKHPDKVHSLILASPFCGLEKGDERYQWFVEGVKTDLKHIFGETPTEVIAADFDRIIAENILKHVAPKLSSRLRVSIIQAGQDDVTPAWKLKAILPLFQVAPTYVELDQDHSFTLNRREFAEAVARMLKLSAPFYHFGNLGTPV